ncbi:MAG: hypothetical protein K2L45_03805 [Muribaculaceae bacterium]|nr:hypothetical protein [Muribaculaceae bacterium]
MKEKDLEKCLDNLIIKGLIQEAEQDNAEFEAAMREMSDEDFLSLICETSEVSTDSGILAEKNIVLARKDSVAMSSDIAFSMSGEFEDNSSDYWDFFGIPEEEHIPEKPEMRQRGWKIWAGAIASVAAILLLVFIPAHREMDSRLCESALLASEAYMGPSRGGGDILTMPKEEVKAMLPELERQFSASLKRDEGIRYMETPENKDSEYYLMFSDPQEAGLALAHAYLRLNMKEKAIEVLRQLSDEYGDSEFEDHCKKLLEILE